MALAIILLVLAMAVLVLCLPFLICMPINLLLFRKIQSNNKADTTISVLVPARDEEKSISALIASVEAQSYPHWELLIMDDHSTDTTQQIVREAAEKNPRIKLLQAPPLPSNWTGKLHTCYHLGQNANHDWLLFIDADLRLEPDALNKLATLSEKQTRMNTALYSGVPRQITGSFLEHLLISLIQVVLLGYLPMWMMRRSNKPGFGAACGQLVYARKEAYLHTQGHGHPSIRSSFHDGVKLPRLFRNHEHHTDLIDVTDLAHVRMYDNPKDVWLGLRKNAIEGMASPKAIIPWSLLLGAQIVSYPLLPIIMALYGLTNQPLILIAAMIMLIITGFCTLYRLILAIRFKQNLIGVILHPLALSVFLIIQWQALWRYKKGQNESWRGREALNVANGI